MRFRALLALPLLPHLLHSLVAATGNDDTDFPPLLDADDISYFFQENDLDGMHWALSNVFARSERTSINANTNSNSNTNTNTAHLSLPQTLVARGGGSTYTTEYKLKADLEQAHYLAKRLRALDNPENLEKAQFFEKVVVPIYEKVLQHIPPLDDLQRTQGLYPFQQKDEMAGISEIYNKALYHTASLSSLDNHDRDQNEFYPDGKTSIPIINPNLDVERIQKEWLGQIAPPPTTTAFLPKTNSNNNKQNALGAPGVVVVDDILSPEAMEEIRNVLLESTVWYQTKMPLKFGGYVGAYIDDGLYDRILLKLAFELHKAFPLIMKDHPLRYLWAYKYDSEYTGINTHADQAAVNVNLWLAPDDANLDKESGGLVVFTTKPPSDWDFERYNADTEYIQKFISGSANVTIPHKQNRAVIFDSALFHHTDKFRFKKGYENRRINLTLLYGTMQREDTKGERAAVTTTSVQEEL